MRRSSTLLFVVLATAASAQPREPSRRCRTACERYLTDARAQASACGVCLLQPGDAGGWMDKLARVPAGARTDDDWQVRWAAVRLEAKGLKTTGARQLAKWIAASEPERELACVTALHVAGEKKQKLAELLSADPPAAAACAARERALVAAVEPDLFSTDPAERRESLAHLVVALERLPARVLLDAMATRPAAFDELAANQLLETSRERDQAAGWALLQAATAKDTATANRLLAVFSKMRDEDRPKLTSASLDERKAAIARLALLAPLSEAELTGALDDASAPIRARAANGLARGEGRSLGDAARARLEGTKPAKLEEKLRWLELLADTTDPACADLSRAAWSDVRQPDALRGAALAAAVACDWKAARVDVVSAAASASVPERLAAVNALSRAPSAPNAPEVLKIVDDALRSPDAPFLAAGARAAARHRLKQHLGVVSALTANTDATVRAAALRALLTMEPASARGKALTALEGDASPLVRAAAIEACSFLGGPQVLAALDRASRTDENPDVRRQATEALRKLAGGGP